MSKVLRIEKVAMTATRLLVEVEDSVRLNLVWFADTAQSGIHVCRRSFRPS